LLSTGETVVRLQYHVPIGLLGFLRDLFKGPQRVELQRADVISEIDQIIAKLPPAQRKMVLARAGRELMIAEERRRLSK
jgi:DNA-directed RNA polymerase specialized sigma24 family protein